MRARRYVVMLACAGAALAVVSAGARQRPPAPRVAVACERGCLSSLVDDYLAALVAHDPGKVRIAANVHEIEAMGFRADYQSPTGWETHAGH